MKSSLTDPPNGSAKASEPANILVVTDSADLMAEIDAILAGREQNLVHSDSGREALRSLLKNDFAVILLDMKLTSATSLEAATQIRKRKRSEHTPIIFLTGPDGESVIPEELLLGVVDYISTPIDPHVLLSKVEFFVELYEKTEVIRQQAAHRVQLAREQAARQVAEKALKRSMLLAEASRILSRSLDIDTTLSSLHRAVVPALADACQLVLYDQSGDLWFASAGRNADANGSAKSSSRIQTVDPRLTKVVSVAIETGHAQPIADEILANAPALRRKSAWGSLLVAPLIARDIPLGAIICARRAVRRRFGPPDTALLEDLSGRAATALDNAQLYQTIRDGERRKDEFLAMLGHELRNPLAAITNAGELTRLLNADDPSFQETLEIIRQQATLMKRLVDDLLDVSRITSGRVQLQKMRVAANEIVARVAEAASPLFTSRGHVLHLSVPRETIYLNADSCRLEQVLSNLMVNAVKYTDPGGQVWFSVEKQGAEVVFRVKDSGIGIGPDLLPNVFDLFSQANRSLHRAEGGLGIGLTIVKGLTELHGGRVEATSEGIGRGAEFAVYLPAASKAEQQRPRDKVDTVDRGCRRRVLVVEDQPALLQVTVALLKKLGHDVRSAADGAEALLAAHEFHPDVMFLDIGLPGMDGYEVAQSLRSEMGDATPVLVAMTGYGEQEVNKHAEKVRFDHHLVKPAGIDAMRHVLAITE